MKLLRRKNKMTRIDIQQFRNNRKTLPLAPYENLGSTLAKTHLYEAKKILSEGWIRKGLPVIKLNKEIPWDKSFEVNRSWSFHIHCWEMLHDLLMAYSETKDNIYFDVCLSVAINWVKKYHSLSSNSPFAWYDMAVGMRAQRLAYILDVAARKITVSDTTVKSLVDSIFLHQKYLANDDNIVFHNNHGFFQATGQLAMAKRLMELPGMQKGCEQAKKRFTRMLATQFTDEGVHKEHSPDYHRMVYHTIKGIIDSGIIEHQPDVVTVSQTIEENLAWFILPNGYLANFGDSDYRNMSRGITFADKWNTPVMKFMASGGKTGSPPTTNYIAHEKSGYFIVRDPWPTGAGDYENSSYLAQTLAFHSRTHKHADDLSFIWYDRNTEILVDSGRYGYLGKTEKRSELFKQGYWYSDPNRIYVEDTRAHNTVEIDGQSFQRAGAKPYGSALQRYGKTKQGLYYSESHVYHFKTIRHYRVLVFKPGQWLLVYDWLFDNKKENHDFRQWFHFAPTLSPVRENDQLVMEIPSSLQPLHMVSLLSGPHLSELFFGETVPQLQGWWSPKERTMIPNPAVAFETKSTQNTTFGTLFSFNQKLNPLRETSKASMDGRNAIFRWINEDGTHELILKRPKTGNIQIEFLTK